ncbi:L-seryl-tRNA(Sec) selenium transferase [Clostridium sp. D2Q-14]|uniref:L-seryl-tRNA(Sec) selenium transferase n=1 Tax=Anaeromonas gelatinilytica TaxID=2683194 RepID=UPI00193C758E|nr:L-seryl-tRNA(Sec) selenium transferase [Anaeromonas gelatinilytica]MBS4535845.1 L-seryl-tRNA(Sec) selenium transferase [Anaeromonas gelatinilytica]
MKNRKELFRNLPKVDEVLQRKNIHEALNYIPREIILESIREVLESIRKDIISENISQEHIEDEIKKIYNIIIEKSKNKINPKLKKIINGTGTIIHTNLGRSLISKNILEKVVEIVSSYSNLEYNLKEGKRGSRYSHIEDIICRITGAEAALVVNNNASAVMLILSTLAKEKEVIVSRGELVEIGGSFRVPEVMEQSGGKLIDIGTTNKTHLSDYELAIGEETAALLKVHTSNYKIVGFTESVPIEDLVNLGRKNNIPVIEDIGSGVLIDLSKYGLSYEPTVQDSLRAGVDIVSFSGDKLLGGPQAGIIVGKKKLIDKMKKNQLTRAIRVDKMIIAVLELVLREYLEEEKAIKNIPTLRMLTMSLKDITKKAKNLYDLVAENIDDVEIQILDDYSQVGGGSLPLEEISTKVLSIKSEYISINKLEENLRKFRIPIITRINNNNLLIDVRTIDENDFNIIVEGIKWSINDYRSE